MPDKAAIAAELVRRGRITPEQAREMGYGEVATQAERGMIGQRLQAPDKIAERNAYATDYKALRDAREAYSRAYPVRTKLDTFDGLNEKSGTGLGYAIPVIGDIAQNFNSNVQQMAGISSELQGQARPPGSGATSDFEQRLYRQGVPSPEKGGAVNQSITATMRGTLAEEGDRLAFQEQFLNRNGTLSGAAEAWARYVADNPYTRSSKTVEGAAITAPNQNRQDWQTYFGLKPASPERPKLAPGSEKATTAQALTAQRYRGSRAAPGTEGNPLLPDTRAEYDNLADGAWYIASDGSVGRKRTSRPTLEARAPAKGGAASMSDSQIKAALGL